jgi:hypothetical protein
MLYVGRWSKPVNLKISNDNNYEKNTIFIPRAKILCFDVGNKKEFCFSPKFLNALVVHRASKSVSTDSPPHRVHWQGRVSDHLFPRSAKIVTACATTDTQSI